MVEVKNQSNLSDSRLLGLTAKGDKGAFTVLVNRYQHRFFSIATRMLGDESEAEDAVQLTFLRVFLKAGAYRKKWKGSTWIYRVLTNICIDAWRKRQNRVDIFGALPSAQETRDGSERLDLEAALARLPAEARMILLLCYLEGLSYAEIARVRGVSVNTVKTQLRRAKRALRPHLIEATNDNE